MDPMPPVGDRPYRPGPTASVPPTPMQPGPTQTGPLRLGPLDSNFGSRHAYQPGPGQAGPNDPAGRRCDPLAAALANASLLSAGYVMLRRPGLAIGSAAVTAILVAILALADHTTWVRVLVPVWWVAVTAHAWFLARGSQRTPSPRPAFGVPDQPPHGRFDRPGRPNRPWTQRLVAFGLVGAVLVILGALRIDAERIEQAVIQAHRANDCSQAISTLEGIWAGHQVVDGGLRSRTADDIEACELLLTAELQMKNDRLGAAETYRAYSALPSALWEGAEDRRADLILAEADEELTRALTGDTEALGDGFGHLSTVLDETRGKADGVGKVLKAFLGGLPTDSPCNTREITDWLSRRPAGNDILDRSFDVVRQVAPAAIVECGDQALGTGRPQEARTLYQEAVEEFPGHALASKAEQGIRQANLAIQLDVVQTRLEVPAGGKPEYCKNPAAYSAADPYRGKGPHRAMLFGNDSDEKFPSSWRAKSIVETVLVICAGETTFGEAVETCEYDSPNSPTGYKDVTFRKKKIPVRVYELRTGKLVADTNVQISGDSCPTVVRYTYYGSFDPGPPSPKYVSSSAADVRAAFRPLITP